MASSASATGSAPCRSGSTAQGWRRCERRCSRAGTASSCKPPWRRNRLRFGMRSFVAGAVLALAGATATAAPADITPAALLDHIKFLASDELKGRGDGSAELEKAAEYVARQFESAGLAPGGDNGTWFQPFELIAGLNI